MKQLSPRDIIIVQGLPPVCTKENRVAIDTEFFNMDGSRLHRPTGQLACVSFCINGKDAYIVTNPDDLKQAFVNIEPAVHIYHHAKFDIFHERRYIEYPRRKRLWDTMIVEQEMFAGYFSDFSLKALARRWLDVYMEKDVRSEFNEATEMTREMMEYAAIDVVATHQIYQKQRAAIDEDTLNVWRDIDLPALWAILSMSGMKLDVDAWKKLAQSKKARIDELVAKYPEIKLSSWQQVLKELHRQGYKDLKSTNEDFLRPITEECPFAADILEFRGLSKAMNTYGEKWVESHVEPDGRVYSDFHVCGAATGRTASSSPNLQNIPIRDGPDFRKCFIAGEDNVLIDADWSAQEPRITAYLSQDEKLIEIFNSKKDVYIEACRLMFGKEITKKDPFRATRMKPVVLGACYGLSEFGLEQKYQIPLEEGKELLSSFFNTFEGVAVWKKHQQSIHDTVSTIYGRKYWLNPYVRNSENNALDSPVQGSAGDALKIAAARFLDKWGWTDKDSILINLIHDEMLIEVPLSLKDAAIQLLGETMIEVAEEMHDGIKADVEVKAGNNWHEAHS